MFNNINDNNKDYLYNSQLGQQSNIINIAAMRANLGKTAYSAEKNSYVDRTEISLNAIDLFHKDQDIAKFNKIALSDMDDLSHIERVQELFRDGVVDAYEDDVLENLVTNSKLLDDLDL